MTDTDRLRGIAIVRGLQGQDVFQLIGRLTRELETAQRQLQEVQHGDR